MKWTYEVPGSIPPRVRRDLARRFGIRVGDAVLLDPASSRAPIVVCREFEHHQLSHLLEPVNHFRLLGYDGPDLSVDPIEPLQAVLRGGVSVGVLGHLRLLK